MDFQRLRILSHFLANSTVTTVKYINHTIISLQNVSNGPLNVYYAEQHHELNEEGNFICILYKLIKFVLLRQFDASFLFVISKKKNLVMWNRVL